MAISATGYLFGSCVMIPSSGYIDAAFGGLLLISIDVIAGGWGSADTKLGSAVVTYVV